MALVRSIPVSLAILIAVGLVLRVAMEQVVHPVIMSPDTVTYVGMALFDLYGDPVRPSGYSMLLAALHFVSTNVDFTVWVQHLMGVATGLLLYAAVRRIGAPVWVGLIAAATVLLGIDQVVHEQALLPEVLFNFLIAAVLYACVRALDEPRPFLDLISTRTAWILAAGALLGLSVWVRAVAGPIIPFFALWFVFALPGPWWRRIGHGALTGGAAAAVVLAYFQLNYMAQDYFGLVQGSGWGIYSRAAPFADCDQFEPPAGTERLCQHIPPEKRPPPDIYGWSPKESPAHRVFGWPPAGNDQVAAFGWAAVRAQPGEYLEAVVSDVGRYFGFGVDSILFTSTRIQWERGDTRNVMPWINDYYQDERYSVGGPIGEVEDLQEVLRVHPWLLSVALVAALAGLVVGRGRPRSMIGVFLIVGLLLVIIPPVTATYNFRYALPANGPLIAAGAVGVWLVITRMTAWLRHRRAAAHSGPAVA
jgi:hypothetical protein